MLRLGFYNGPIKDFTDTWGHNGLNKMLLDICENLSESEDF